MAATNLGRADYLQLGDWNAACGYCGRKRKASELKQLPPGVPGAGLYVCPEHWFEQQPQDFVRGIPDQPAAPWVQPSVDIMTVPTYNIDEDGNQSVATSSSYTTILSIFEGVTVPTLTLSGTGALLVNNWGIVNALVNPGPATITLRNYGKWL